MPRELSEIEQVKLGGAAQRKRRAQAAPPEPLPEPRTPDTRKPLWAGNSPMHRKLAEKAKQLGLD
jgi:hypothetical protein